MIHIGSKTAAAAGVAEPLAATHTPAMWVDVQALTGNGGQIYLGDSTVTSANGRNLSRLESFMMPPCGNTYPYDLALIYINPSVGGEGVSYMYGK